MAEISIDWPYLELCKDLILLKPDTLSLIFEHRATRAFLEITISAFLFNHERTHAQD
jgi:hypothetical protein